MNDTISILIAARLEEDQKLILGALSGQININTAGVSGEVSRGASGEISCGVYNTASGTGCFAVSTVNDETGVIIKTQKLKPDILILDWQLSETTGPDLVQIIRRRSPSTAIILICGSGDRQDEVYTNHSIITCISGFLLKESDIDKLIHIINIIILGGCYINASITVKILKMALINNFYFEAENISISQLERSIISLIARGFSDTQIAGELNYSAGTIRNYITGIRYKIKMKSRIEIVNYSIASGIISPEHVRRGMD